jgi:hypothetical protein
MRILNLSRQEQAQHGRKITGTVYRVVPDRGVYVDNSNAADKHIQYYSFFTTNTPGYAIAPQIVAPDGTQTLTFKSSLTAGSSAGSTGTIEVGFVDGVTTADMASFTKIGNTITLTSTDTQYSVPIPASNKQYIAFKIVGSLNHRDSVG